MNKLDKNSIGKVYRNKEGGKIVIIEYEKYYYKRSACSYFMGYEMLQCNDNLLTQNKLVYSENGRYLFDCDDLDLIEEWGVKNKDEELLQFMVKKSCKSANIILIEDSIGKFYRTKEGGKVICFRLYERTEEDPFCFGVVGVDRKSVV